MEIANNDVSVASEDSDEAVLSRGFHHREIKLPKKYQVLEFEYS